MTYDPAPAYPLARGVVDKGLPPLGTGARAVALDGPPALPWDAVIAGLRGALGPDVELVDVLALEDAPLLGAARYAAS